MTAKVSKEKIRVMLVSGYTYREIAEECGVTRSAVGQWRRKWFPNLLKKEFGAGKRHQDLLSLRTRRNRIHGDDSISRAKSAFFMRKRQNARRGKWEFTVDYTDIDWVDHCPIFNTPFNWEAGTRREDSPSLDRIDPMKGYIPGNVALVSWRANRIKNDGTAEEHRQIYEFMTRYHCKST